MIAMAEEEKPDIVEITAAVHKGKEGIFSIQAKDRPQVVSTVIRRHLDEFSRSELIISRRAILSESERRARSEGGPAPRFQQKKTAEEVMAVARVTKRVNDAINQTQPGGRPRAVQALLQSTLGDFSDYELSHLQTELAHAQGEQVGSGDQHVGTTGHEALQAFRDDEPAGPETPIRFEPIDPKTLGTLDPIEFSDHDEEWSSSGSSDALASKVEKSEPTLKNPEATEPEPDRDEHEGDVSKGVADTASGSEDRSASKNAGSLLANGERNATKEELRAMTDDELIQDWNRTGNHHVIDEQHRRKTERGEDGNY